MDQYAVIGHPIEHSRSPHIHARFAAQTGQEMAYTRQLAPLDGFTATLQALVAGGLRGSNVTVPFKFEAYSLAARRTPRAELAQAANTLRFDADGWWADNTDGVGLVRDIQDHAGVALAGKRVLLIGAGGAAAGVLGPLVEALPAELVVVNRSADRADLLIERHAELARLLDVPLLTRPIDDCGIDYDVLINASASSLAGQAAPVAASALRPGCLALDMMYGAAALPFLAWAEAHGAHPRDGLGMLVEQAAESFFAWRDVRPHTTPVLAELRERVAEGL
jgi:shikimate dehydrogenase